MPHVQGQYVNEIPSRRDNPPDFPPHPGGPLRLRTRKRRRGIALLPSLFTLGNCLSGFASLNYSARSSPPGPDGVFSFHFAVAGYFIFLAMAFDLFDGFVARLTHSASDFGAELDSLADMVSFGIAPAFLSIHLIGELMRSQNNQGNAYLAIPGPFQDNDWLRLFWIIAGTYVACTALRLARFNMGHQHDTLSHMSFRGIPSPGAAAVVAGSVVFFVSLGLQPPWGTFNVSPQVREGLEKVFPYFLPVVLLVAALLMVSRFVYAHLINRFLRGRKRFRTVVGFVLLVMVIFWEPQISILLGVYIYALSAPAAWIYRLMGGRGKSSSPSPPAPPPVSPPST